MTDARSATFLISGLPLGGGAETQVARVSRELLRRGWLVDVVEMSRSDSLPSEIEGSGVRVTSLEFSARRPLRPFFELVSRLRSTRPQALVCFMFHANLVGRLAGRLAGVPVIVTSIRNENFGPRWREWAERASEPLGQAVTCNSSVVAQGLVRRGVVSAGRIEVIPNCCDLPALRPEGERERLRARLAPGDEFLWLSVGSLTPQKDRVGLVRAFARAFAETPGVRLAIAGGGPERDAVLAAAHLAGVAERVELLGVRDDVPGLLGAADAFVLSSLWEGSPNALIEAALAGVPTVSTDSGGVSELIEDGVSGLLVPPADPEALGLAMLRLASLTSEARRRLGQTAREKLSLSVGVATVVDRWENLLIRLAGD